MKSKEELIEVMKVAYEKAYLAHKPNPKTIAPYALEIDWFPPTDYLMEAALKALCGALPELTYTMRAMIDYHGAMTNDLPCEAVDNAKELYSQLKQWGKDESIN